MKEANDLRAMTGKSFDEAPLVTRHLDRAVPYVSWDMIMESESHGGQGLLLREGRPRLITRPARTDCEPAQRDLRRSQGDFLSRLGCKPQSSRNQSVDEPGRGI